MSQRRNSSSPVNVSENHTFFHCTGEKSPGVSECSPEDTANQNGGVEKCTCVGGVYKMVDFILFLNLFCRQFLQNGRSQGRTDLREQQRRRVSQHSLLLSCLCSFVCVCVCVRMRVNICNTIWSLQAKLAKNAKSWRWETVCHSVGVSMLSLAF